MAKKKIKKEKKEFIEEVRIDSDFTETYIGYGKDVITDRVLPSVLDGLKPVQRRALYTYKEDGITSKDKFKKSAKVVGNIMGNYHPHGDSGIYTAIVNMTQPWRSDMPLIQGDGNFGNLQGLPAAAMRYTETRLSKFGDLFVKELKNDVVDFTLNYSDDLKEPVLLPIQLPYLLIAGTYGIAVGMVTDIPPHNPIEVINATIAFIKDNKISLDKLLSIMPGPDFKTKGTILNSNELKNFYETGRQKLYIKGSLKKDKKNNKIIITEIPYTMIGGFDNYIESFIDKIDKKIIKNAKQIKDFSNKNGICIEIDAAPGASLDELALEIEHKTSFQNTYSPQFNVLADGMPKTINLKEYFQYYVDFQNQIIIRKAKYQSEKIKNRLSIIEGLFLAIEHIDAVIEVIRNSKNKKDVIHILKTGEFGNLKLSSKKTEKIVNKFSFKEEQAQAIVNLRLIELSNIDNSLLLKEKGTLEKDLLKNEGIINSKTKRKNELIKIHKDSLKLFEGCERRTKLENSGKIDYQEKEKIEQVNVIIDKFGYIKCVMNDTEESDDFIFNKKIKNNKSIGIMTNKGNFYSLNLSKLKITSLKDKGNSFAGLVKADPQEHFIIGELGSPIIKGSDAKILQVTKLGYTKWISSKELVSNRTKIVGSKLKTDDELIYSKEYLDKDYIVFISKNGLVKKIKSIDAKGYKKTSIGLQLCKVNNDDYIIQVKQVNNNDYVFVNGIKVKVSNIKISKQNNKMKKIE